MRCDKDMVDTPLVHPIHKWPFHISFVTFIESLEDPRYLDPALCALNCIIYYLYVLLCLIVLCRLLTLSLESRFGYLDCRLNITWYACDDAWISLTRIITRFFFWLLVWSLNLCIACLHRHSTLVARLFSPLTRGFVIISERNFLKVVDTVTFVKVRFLKPRPVLNLKHLIYLRWFLSNKNRKLPLNTRDRSCKIPKLF